MPERIISEHLNIGGMTCVGCENRIEKAPRGASRVTSASTNYAGGYADVSYNPDVISRDEICGIGQINRSSDEVMERVVLTE
jgi:copper chaperone CopZ